MLELCDTGRSAEIAIAVAAEHRERGVARALLRRALLKAAGLGKERVVFTCLTENLPMRRLARSAGLTVITASSEIESEQPLEESALGNAAGVAAHELVGKLSYATHCPRPAIS